MDICFAFKSDQDVLHYIVLHENDDWSGRENLLFTLGLGGLLLALVLLGSGRTGKRLLENLENLLILELLVGLDFFEVDGIGGSELGDTILGDGWGRQLALHFRL